MEDRPAVRNLWRAAREGIARLNQRLAESADADEQAVFQPASRDIEGASDAQRRIAEARKARANQ